VRPQAFHDPALARLDVGAQAGDIGLAGLVDVFRLGASRSHGDQNAGGGEAKADHGVSPRLIVSAHGAACKVSGTGRAPDELHGDLDTVVGASAGLPAASAYDPALAQLVYGVYEPDFVTLGYGRDSWRDAA